MARLDRFRTWTYWPIELRDRRGAGATRRLIPAMSKSLQSVRLWRRRPVTRRVVLLSSGALAVCGLLLTAAVAVASGLVAAIESKASVSVGQQITFDASSSTYEPSYPIRDYRWDLDGSGKFATDTGTTKQVTATYSAPGTLNVSVRVTDTAGRQSVATEQLTITGSAAGSTPTSGGSSPPTGGGGDAGGIGPTIGGDPAAGIAGLTASDLKTIVAGSDKHFAAITGTSVRRANVVARHGLWIGVLADRAATFTLTVSMRAVDARRLRLAGRRARGLVHVGSAVARLQTAGQRPLDIRLASAVRSRLRRLRARVRLVVTGTAVDVTNHTAAVSRSFAIRP